MLQYRSKSKQYTTPIFTAEWKNNKSMQYEKKTNRRAKGKKKKKKPTQHFIKLLIKLFAQLRAACEDECNKLERTSDNETKIRTFYTCCITTYAYTHISNTKCSTINTEFTSSFLDIHTFSSYWSIRPIAWLLLWCPYEKNRTNQKIHPAFIFLLNYTMYFDILW